VNRQLGTEASCWLLDAKEGGHGLSRLLCTSRLLRPVGWLALRVATFVAAAADEAEAAAESEAGLECAEKRASSCSASFCPSSSG